MNTYWRQISDNLQKRVSPGIFRVWIAPLRAELESASGADDASAQDVVASAKSVVASVKDAVASKKDVVTSEQDVLASAKNVVASKKGVAASGKDVVTSVKDAVASAKVFVASAKGGSASEKDVVPSKPSAKQASLFAEAPQAVCTSRAGSAACPQKTAAQTGIPGSDLLHVLAPNEFVANWVRNRLFDVLVAAAEDVLGADTRVVLEVAPQAPAAVAPVEPDPRTTMVPHAIFAPENAPARASRSQQSAPCVQFRAEQLSLPIRTTRAYTWRYGFDGFVVGPCNDMAHAAARNMLPDHGAVDTLFLSSGPGLGKTHLTQAVGQALCEAANRKAKVEYLSAESYCTAFVQSMKARDIDAFKARFRDVDVLLLEDVHFLQGKEKMQVEVLSTIKSLQERGSRVVLTSTFAPRELNNLDPTLVSRFCSGFLAGMEKPDFGTRRRILMDKALKSDALLSGDVCDLMAERLSGDVRQLESCLYNLLLRAKLQNCKISMNMAADILAQYAQCSPFADLDSITRRVCEGFGLNPEQLASRSRRNAHVTARNTVFYLARKHTDLSLQDIGEHFNRRHSTVLKGIAAVERELTRETSLGRQIAATLTRIEARTQH